MDKVTLEPKKYKDKNLADKIAQISRYIFMGIIVIVSIVIFLAFVKNIN